MFFEIRPADDPTHVRWVLVKSDGTIVALSPRTYNDEAECRAAIAKTKVSMRGARFAKVKVV